MAGETPDDAAAPLELSIVIPAYNEEDRLQRAIPAVYGHLEALGRPFEVIVVDDGSRDGTARVASELAAARGRMRVLSLQPNQGKGGAVRAGMLAAAGRYVLFTDADLSTPIAEMDALLARVETDGYDIAIGSRAVKGARVEQAQAWHRGLASKLFALARKALVLRGVADTQCGFKCCTRAAAQAVFQRLTTASAIFDIEMLVVATRLGLRIAEVPVSWVHDPDTRIPYDLRRSLAIWGELFRIRRAQRVRWPLRART